MNSSGLVLPAGSPMRDGNVTGRVNAPLPAFASPFPSVTDPRQSTSTCRSKVIDRLQRSACPRTLVFLSGYAELHDHADEADNDPGANRPAIAGYRQRVQNPDVI